MKKITLKTLVAFTALVSFQLGFSQNLQKSVSIAQNDQEFVPNEYSQESLAKTGVIKCLTTENTKILEKKFKGKFSTAQFEKFIAPKIAQLKADKTSRQRPVVYTIPVVVHVIHNGDALGSDENLADAQVESQIQVLNEDFGNIPGTPGDGGAGVDTGIRFCLAKVDPDGNATNGINRVNRFRASWNTRDDIEAILKPNTIWDPNRYLNIWTIKTGGPMSSTLGYAQFPSGSDLPGLEEQECDSALASTDGVVCTYTAFGSRSIYPNGIYISNINDRGRTMTHEVGHMLSLRHIWGDGPCGEDDFCADTPESDDSNYGCLIGHRSCGTVDMVQNYMDYSNDSCMNIFTQDQANRMVATLLNADRRLGLLSSNVCNPLPTIQYKLGGCQFKAQQTVVEPNQLCGGFDDISIPLEIDLAPNRNTTVTFSVNPNSTAVVNEDFIISTPTISFPANSKTDKTLNIRLFNNDINNADKELIIDFTINANGGNAVKNNDRDSYKIILKNDDFLPVYDTSYAVFEEDFENRDDWTALDRDGDGRIFSATAGLSGQPGINGTCAFSASNLAPLGGNGDLNPDNYYLSPSMTIPADLTSAELALTVGSYHLGPANSTKHTETVSVYFTTTPTSSIRTYNQFEEFNIFRKYTMPSRGTVNLEVDIASFLVDLRGKTGYFVVRHHESDAAEGLLLLDNFKVNVTKLLDVQTATNPSTAAQRLIDKNGSFYADDETSGDVIADITNKTASDYGCTDVSVSRSGNGAQNFTGTATADQVMNKTFTITPGKNPTSNNIDIDFYFTEAELSGWESATGLNRSELAIRRVGANSSETTTATITAFGPHWKVKGTFTSGMEGTYYFGRQSSLSVETNDIVNSLSIYPNPATTTLNIGFESNASDVQLSLFDIRGRRVIFANKANNSNKFETQLNVSNLESGVYLLNITDSAINVTKKIVIK